MEAVLAGNGSKGLSYSYYFISLPLCFLIIVGKRRYIDSAGAFVLSFMSPARKLLFISEAVDP